ncbi:Uncharacterised protein [Vibrio cholerae]|nr:Uncharacterised protein [Vibrio cholerae]CSC47445.1 Uncharacterised protein [Vibrio cholerae]CSC92260.1 Uncharacterised protein [Vibrio cholerae]
MYHRRSHTQHIHEPSLQICIQHLGKQEYHLHLRQCSLLALHTHSQHTILSCQQLCMYQQQK